MHRNGDCDSCLSKLTGCHPDIVSFYYFVKERHPDAHISWGYRGQADQDKFFEQGLSNDKWPHSKHNFTDNGLPKSKALDLFQLGADGRAYFDLNFFQTVYSEAKEAGLKIIAGLTWPKPDSDHFELDLS